MRGADHVRDRLCLLLQTEMPRKAPLLREAWNLDSAALPDVGQFVSGDIAEEAIGKHDGLVIVVNPRLLRSVPTGDFSPEGEPEYHSTYSCRVYVWAKGPDWDRATAARDNLAASARLSILQYPTLSVEGGDTGYRLNGATYTEDYGVPVRVQGSRTLAAAILSVDMLAEEVIDDGSTRPRLGTVQELAAASYAVGPTTPFHGED